MIRRSFFARAFAFLAAAFLSPRLFAKEDRRHPWTIQETDVSKFTADAHGLPNRTPQAEVQDTLVAVIHVIKDFIVFEFVDDHLFANVRGYIEAPLKKFIDRGIIANLAVTVAASEDGYGLKINVGYSLLNPEIQVSQLIRLWATGTPVATEDPAKQATAQVIAGRSGIA